jgi:hypothetical protein
VTLPNMALQLTNIVGRPEVAPLAFAGERPYVGQDATMRQYLLYVVAGYIELWLVLVPLGFSNGMVAPWPYYAILGGLILIAASTISVVVEKPAAAAAALASLVFLVWPVGGVAAGGFGSDELTFAVILAVLPTVVIADAIIRFVRRPREPWFSLRPGPRAALRTLMAALPMLAIAATINVPLLVAIILQGPAR